MSNDLDQIRSAYRARFNKLRKHTRLLRFVLDGTDPDTIEGVTIGDMRDEVEAITQCFHEFSAYHNAFHTVGSRLSQREDERDAS